MAPTSSQTTDARLFAVMLGWPEEKVTRYQGYAVLADSREEAITRVETHFGGKTFAVTGAARMQRPTAERLHLTEGEVWPL